MVATEVLDQAEMPQLAVVEARAARAAREQAHLRKMVARAARENHRAFLVVLLFMLLAVVVD
jgi:hypothetical protein